MGRRVAGSDSPAAGPKCGETNGMLSPASCLQLWTESKDPGFSLQRWTVPGSLKMVQLSDKKG